MQSALKWLTLHKFKEHESHLLSFVFFSDGFKKKNLEIVKPMISLPKVLNCPFPCIDMKRRGLAAGDICSVGKKLK